MINSNYFIFMEVEIEPQIQLFYLWYQKTALCPGWHRAPTTPWHFLSDRNDRSVLYSNEMTLGECLDTFRVGACCQKKQDLIRNMGISAPCPKPLGSEEELKIELITHYAYVMKPP